MKEIYRCPVCKSLDVQGLAFARINEPRGEPDFMVDCKEDTWCPTCKEHAGSEVVPEGEAAELVARAPEVDDELLIMAKVLILQSDTPAARVIRALLHERGDRQRVVDAMRDAKLPCSCSPERRRMFKGANGRNHEPIEDHEAECFTRLGSAINAAHSAWFEYRRVLMLRGLLIELTDAVSAEVAIHPGIHDSVAKAWKNAEGYLRVHSHPNHPGDDDMPF